MGAGGYVIHMLVPVLLVVAAWIVLSIPVAVLVGRMFAAGHVDRDAVGRRSANAPHRVAYLSRVEARRSAAARWPHEARVLATSRRRVPVVSGSAGRVTGDVAH